MAAISGINAATQTTGAREDLSNTITMISPEETPLFTNAQKTTATAINHEWQTDTLDNGTINSHVEGESVTTSTAGQTTRLGNICQISQRSYGVSNTVQALNLAGRDDEMLRLRMKKGLELRRDMEVVLHTNQAKVTDTTGATARKLGGLPTYITNNVGVDVSAGNGDGSSAITSSGSTAITYEFVSSAGALAYTAGGSPDLIELSPSLKRKWSLLAFGSSPSTAIIRYNVDKAGQAIAVGAVEKWQSDFGLMDIIVNRQLKNTAGTFLNQAVFILDTQKIAVAMMRSFEVKPLAVTGDGKQEFVVSEYTLQPLAPAAHAAAYGMT
jgi:hypothetical protein